MRILFIHERMGAFAGAEANILATATELAERGHTVGLLHGPGTGKAELEWMHIFSHRYSFEPVANGSISEALARFQPDLLYLHKLGDLDLLEALLDTGIPLVRMVHDHDLYCMRGYKYNYFTRHICARRFSPYCVFPCGASVARNRQGHFPLQWVSYRNKMRELELNRRCARLLVASQFMKTELLRNHFEADKIEIRAPVPPKADTSWTSSFSDRNFVVYAGQIVRGKGVDVLLQSLARVTTPFQCWIFGDGHHRAHCEKLSRRLGLASQVHFKGHVPSEEISILYREATVAVVSSIWPEPFGAVGLEAMRYGLPVVAFDSGGIHEWLVDGQNGYLVPWMDRAAFAARVEELLRNKPLARSLGERGRQMIADRFDFGSYITGLENLFARLAHQNPIPALA